MTPDELQELKGRRFRFLYALYRECNRDSAHSINLKVQERLYKSARISRDEWVAIQRYLRAEGLINRMGYEGPMAITHKGITEVEAAIANPKKETEYFGVVYNIINVHQMFGSQIQQGTKSSSQTVTTTGADFKAVQEFIAALKMELPHLGLSDDALKEAAADATTVEAQLSSSRPKKHIIEQCLLNIRKVLENAPGNLIADAFGPQLIALLHQLWVG